MASSSRVLALLVGLGLGGLPLATAGAKVFHTQKEALALAFPEADEIRSRTVVLSAEQARAIEKLARGELETEIVKLYSGWRGGRLLGHAYIDVHTVRTLPEAFLVVLSPEGQVRSLRVLAFHEPLDYMPTARWYRQFEGKSSRDPIRLGREIHGILGATLSARAVTRSVRRAQAFYEVLIRPDGPAARN